MHAAFAWAEHTVSGLVDDHREIYCFKPLPNSRARDIVNLDENIDDRLGSQTWNGSRPDVLDPFRSRA